MNKVRRLKQKNRSLPELLLNPLYIKEKGGCIACIGKIQNLELRMFDSKSVCSPLHQR